ncbi:MAG: 2-amino-4-hydroxy-6-hydroxymethyldihydropteridine diphosphokinase [Ginsengibacter sp.]
MNKAYLLIGSNEGNRLQHLANARDLVQQKAGDVNDFSLIYETAAWGRLDQPDFLNQVLTVTTRLTAHSCLHEILAIENAMGRIRRKKNDPRIIDIDILFFNDEIINDNNLVVPHPEIQNRRFALVPMNELSPGMMHPVLNRTIASLLSTCTDQLQVSVFSK